jgi:hypothetical protein
MWYVLRTNFLAQKLSVFYSLRVISLFEVDDFYFGYMAQSADLTLFLVTHICHWVKFSHF